MTVAPSPCFDIDEPDRIERDFWAFHIANPRVYTELRDHALHLRSKGRTHYGIKALFEVVRFHRALQTTDKCKEWKINNNYSALYARLLMANEPELRDFFRTRIRRPRLSAMKPNDLLVDYYVDAHGHDCYRICIPEHGPCSIVSSAHLIDERKTQLLRAYCSTTPTPS